MMNKPFLAVLGFALLLSAQVIAEPNKPTEPAQSYALLVGGIAGQEPYGQWYKDWLARFQTYLTKEAGVPAPNVTALLGDAATTDAITGAIGKIAQRAKPQDQFILFIVGHGENINKIPTLTLKGPDLTADQLAAALAAVPAKSQVILNFSADSGDFLKRLISPNRANMTATSPNEIKDPVFPEFFLRGLESKRADADKNGTITLLEAYNWAVEHTAQWIAHWEQTGDPMQSDTIMWKASGRETVEIFEKLYSKGSNRKLDPASDSKTGDAVVELRPPNGEVTGEWGRRRVIDEHAEIEDSGVEIGVATLGDNGFQPILGQKSGDPGYLMGHIVLGKSSPPNP